MEIASQGEFMGKGHYQRVHEMKGRLTKVFKEVVIVECMHGEVYALQQIC